MNAAKTSLALCIFALSASTLSAADEGLDFFEKKIRPALVNNCYVCHSAEAKTRMGGLTLDTADGVLAGGQRGEAIVPGDPEASLLIQAINHAGKLKMPPQGKLPEAVIEDFEQWVAMGAPDPRKSDKAVVTSTIDLEKGREYWAFQTPKRSPLPQVADSSWPRGAIDHFILAKLEDKGLDPVGDASREALIRRATFDLVGLPPTPEEIAAFVDDPAPDQQALKKIIDRLLDSPQFGERWGRHWFDIARYADSMGRTRNAPFPLAWRYRDYVIAALNADKPYDRFIREQLAGDLLGSATPEERRENLVATGFLALGAHDLNEIDRKLFPADVADEMINVTTRSFMAMTVGCARCHDHKFDPIPQADYYSMAGIFRSTELLAGVRQRPIFNAVYFHKEKLVELDGLSPYGGERAEEYEARYREIWAELVQAEEDRNRDRVRELARELNKLPIPQNLAMGVGEADKIINEKVNLGGDPHELGEVAPRGFLQVVYEPDANLPKIPKKSSGRLELAQWLTRADNPLTPRVMANRVWHHLFGRGIVSTVDNFGKMGAAPSHPELLDYLALQFVEGGWSIKSLIREVMLSHAYALSTDFNEKNFEQEPDNELVWRMNRRRLEVEAIRDAVLKVSGELTLAPPDSSPVEGFDPNTLVRAGNKQMKSWELDDTHRSIYVPIIRNQVNRLYETFDFPEPSETHGARDVTTVAPQALFMMNSDFVSKHSSIASERLLAKVSSDADRVRTAYRQTLSRDPNEQELERALEFIRSAAEHFAAAPEPALEAEAEGPRKKRKRRAQAQASAEPAPAEGQQAQQAWSRLYHALIESAEFRYRG